jgi:transmembrane sensor
MDYKLYEIEDFVSDESYLRYYFRLNDSDVLFWQDWIRTHPEKLDKIINADQLINFLFLQLSEEEFQQECERMLDAIKVSKRSLQPEMKATDSYGNNNKKSFFATSIRLKRKTVLWLAAASILVFICVGFFHMLSNNKTDEVIAVKLLGENKLKQVNNTHLLFKLQLEDGTLVTLQPGATLMYPPHFLPGKREVYLTGEAFFEVSKNAKRPFYVYYNNLVTHVLGTSFTIKIDKDKKQVEVSVRTGRVEVYERPIDGSGATAGIKGNGVILTPNQKVIYNEEINNFESTLVDAPIPVVHESVKGEKIAVDVNKDNVIIAASLSDIIASIETIYQLSIEVESDNIKNCHFSGDISAMGLYAKLEVICKSIGATYEIKGTKIIIRGKGCD